ncbi:MAG: YfhO family protein [Prevotella sp.]|jgi:hypothetical protein|nr:YfhO family protein [Prevotella sp.]
MKRTDNLLDQVAANRKSHFRLFLSVLLVLSLLMMYFYNPLQPGQDFFFHYRRLQALMDGMGTGPYLIYLDYGAMDGYGYFAKAFYPDFVLIPFACIGNLTSIEFAYQFMIFTMTILCGIFTYIFVNKVYKNSFAASVSALLYTFAVYRLLDIYHRAAIGEALTFTFLPLVFLGLYHIIKGDYKKWYILAIGFSLMILTHLISSLLLFITVLIFFVIYYKPLFREPQRVRCLLLAGAATVFITAYYTFPMIEQMASGTFYYESRDLMSKTQDSALKMNWIVWGLFSGIIHPRQVFIPGTGLLLTCAVALRLFVYGKSKELRSADILVILGLAFVFASSFLFPWSIFPFNKLNFIQLPWRLFEFSTFFFAVAGGYYLSQAFKSRKRLAVAGFSIVIVIVSVMANDGKLYQDVRSNRPITQVAALENDYHLGGLEYMPDKVPSPEYIAQRGDRVGKKYEDTKVTSFRKGGVTVLDIITSEPETLELPLLYYKGYKAVFNGEEIQVSESGNGLVQIPVEKSGSATIYYAGTFIQKSGYYITLISIIALCVFIALQRRKVL